MRDGQVEDQAPAASGIAQILSDLHVAAAVAIISRLEKQIDVFSHHVFFSYLLQSS